MDPRPDHPPALPRQLSIQAVGAAEGDLGAPVVATLRRPGSALGEGAVSRRLDRGRRHLPVTVVVEAGSRRQVEGVYPALTAGAPGLVAP